MKSTPPQKFRRTQRQLICTALLSMLIWAVSQWWEKGLATSVEDKQFVSNGCAYVQTFKPYWILPNIFHPKHDPNGDIPGRWFTGWGYPGFYRLFDSRNGALLGETEIYDLEYTSGRLWEDDKSIYAGIIYIGPSIRECPIKSSSD